jgi:hypothetical protein
VQSVNRKVAQFEKNREYFFWTSKLRAKNFERGEEKLTARSGKKFKDEVDEVQETTPG